MSEQDDDTGRIPIAVYRLQFNADFTFDDAAGLTSYLHRLGISHCYASPYLKARAGSPHGYDIVDHNALNPEIGTRASLDRFVDSLHTRGMGQILDIVPNHMGIGGDDNRWWLDVLENGESSPLAEYFDIDWYPIKEELRGKVLVPVLGDHYGTTLEGGQLELRYDSERGEFSVYFYQHRFPIDPGTYPQVLELNLERLGAELGQESPPFLELQSLITAFSHLPARSERAPESIQERLRDKEIHKAHLKELANRTPEIYAHIARNVDEMNGSPGTPRSFDNLHQLLESQAYRLAYWQVALDEINYRRFFDINDLAGLRMERPEVFHDTHKLILELIREGKVDGLRIDHPDGLYDPVKYYRELQFNAQAALPDQIRAEQPRTEPVDELYMVVEKILASYEHLIEDWPVHGTTGYDFVNLVNGLFIEADAEVELDRTYSRFIGRRIDFDDMLYERKKLTIDVQLSSELTVLSNLLDDIAEGNRRTRDFTLIGCRDALTVLVATFPIYRTYITEKKVSDEDARYVDWAIAQAKKRSPAADVSIFDFIRQILLEGTVHANDDYRRRAAHFAQKFQQYTAPVMAKALEDTAFYIYNRLISLNEVGGDPRRFSTTVAAFHHANQDRLRRWPYAMVATSTHDTKRSEDVRARINVLTESPDLWRKHLARWTRINRSKRRIVDGSPAPSRNDEYLLYQTLVGAWPLAPVDEGEYAAFVERIKGYMLKAVKEAKISTSWINPNDDYEQAIEQFVEGLLSPSGQNPFLADFAPFVDWLSRFGLLNSLSQTALKLTAPGVPDIFQGTELWSFSLVDPDNRRPVDYALRERLLVELEERARREPLSALAQELAGSIEDGRAKLYLTWKALGLRQREPGLFARGDYIPVAAEGRRAYHICAFLRRLGESSMLCVVPRFTARLGASTEGNPFPPGLWQSTSVVLPEPERLYENILTGQTIEPVARAGTFHLEAEDLFRYFPVALLVSRRDKKIRR